MRRGGQWIKAGLGKARRAALRVRARLPRGPQPAILMYHRIADEPFDPWGLAVTPTHFSDQLSWLAAHRTVLRLADFAALHRAGALPRDAIAVTIDDGYACSSALAAPLLEQFRIPATLFLPIDLIERERPFWWDELEQIVLGHPGPNLSVGGTDIAIGAAEPADRRWPPRSKPTTARQAAFEAILTAVTRKSPDERDRIMDDLRRQTAPLDELPPAKRPLSPVEARRLAGTIIELGGHTRSHPWLPDLDDDHQRREIGGCIDRLHELTGTRPTAFAYPYGTSDERSRRLVEESGIECACVTGDLGVSPRSSSLALPRMRVGDWDAAGLQQALARLVPA